MTEEKAGGGSSSKDSNSDSGIRHLEGKASGDQGVLLQPTGGHEDNPFGSPSQSPSQSQTPENPGATSPSGDSPTQSGDDGNS